MKLKIRVDINHITGHISSLKASFSNPISYKPAAFVSQSHDSADFTIAPFWNALRDISVFRVQMLTSD